MPRPTTTSDDDTSTVWPRAVVDAPDAVYWMARAKVTEDGRQVYVYDRNGKPVGSYTLDGPGTTNDDGTFTGKVKPGEYVAIREDQRCACVGFMKETR